jgi:hypothetical protein
MSVQRWESREPDAVVQPDPAMLRAMDRQRLLANLRNFGIGALVFAAIAGLFLSAYVLAMITGTAAGALLIWAFIRWIASRE